MKFQVVVLSVVLSTFFSTAAFGAPQLFCSLDMNQVDASNPWGMSGDSNKDLNLTLSPMATPYEDQFTGEQTVRFENDQSQGRGLSLHGLKFSVVYSDGNGLGIVMSLLKFSSPSQNAKASIVSTVSTGVSYEMTPDLLKAVNVSIVGEKFSMSFASPGGPNLSEMIKNGTVKTGDLIAAGINFCRFTE